MHTHKHTHASIHARTVYRSCTPRRIHNNDNNLGHIGSLHWGGALWAPNTSALLCVIWVCFVLLLFCHCLCGRSYLYWPTNVAGSIWLCVLFMPFAFCSWAPRLMGILFADHNCVGPGTTKICHFGRATWRRPHGMWNVFSLRGFLYKKLECVRLADTLCPTANTCLFSLIGIWDKFCLDVLCIFIHAFASRVENKYVNVSTLLEKMVIPFARV